MQIFLDHGDIGGTYLIGNNENNKTILIQTDFDYPGLANTFG